MEKLKIKWWKNICHTNTNQKKSDITIIILDKIVLKITGEPVVHFIPIKWSILQERDDNSQCVNAYQHILNKYKAKIAGYKGEIDISTVIVGEFHSASRKKKPTEISSNN